MVGRPGGRRRPPHMVGRPGYSRWLGGELTFGLAPILSQPYCLQRPRGKRSRGQEQVARPVPALERRSVGVISFSGQNAIRSWHPALGSSAMKVAQRPARRRDDARAAVEVSIVMPCLNEVETLAACIAKAREAIERGGYSAEIIVADNGSSDGSQLIARELGARVVDVQRKGYGSALIGGTDAALGRYVVMGDADASYDFAAIGPLIAELREGYDLVVGNRFL